MPSARAEEVAEILWELKRADKVATFTTIAQRAGFSAGTNGRTMKTTLKTVRRDWPHLQWWRAVNDTGQVEKEQAEILEESGFPLSEVKEEPGLKQLAMEDISEQLMVWEEEPKAAEAEATE